VGTSGAASRLLRRRRRCLRTRIGACGPASIGRCVVAAPLADRAGSTGSGGPRRRDWLAPLGPGGAGCRVGGAGHPLRRPHQLPAVPAAPRSGPPRSRHPLAAGLPAPGRRRPQPAHSRRAGLGPALGEPRVARPACRRPTGDAGARSGRSRSPVPADRREPLRAPSRGPRPRRRSGGGIADRRRRGADRSGSGRAAARGADGHRGSPTTSPLAGRRRHPGSRQGPDGRGPGRGRPGRLLLGDCPRRRDAEPGGVRRDRRA
jgi:hypothetical protein